MITEHGLYGHSVVLFDTYKATPVFHRPGKWKDGDAVTPCGERHSEAIRNAAGDVEDYQTRGIDLDPRHAIRFARPCRRCYRGGAQEHLEEVLP